jgi:hypothetical protein
MKNLQKLDSLFNIDPLPENTSSDLIIPEKMNSNKELDKEDDYQLARQTLRKLIIKGEDTLENLIELSKNSETPRHYEVAGQFIKTLSDVSKDLLNLQKQVKDLEEDSGGTNHINTQNNVVFAGSTNDLMKLLGKDNGEKTIDQ